MSRAARFVWVGAGGFVVQALTLQALAAAGVPYLIATAAAVEAAILHNFLWHERWTWADRSGTGRTRSHERAERTMRFLRFNGSTALISVGGNLALMALLAGYLGLPLVPANLLAVAALSLLNYLSADRLVFTTKLTHQQGNPTPM